MQKPILIFGAGSVAKIAHNILTGEDGRKVVGFVVDKDHKTSDSFMNLPIVLWDDAVDSFLPRAYDMFVAVGYKSILKRESVFLRALDAKYNLINVISQRATILNLTNIGINNLVLPGAVLEYDVSLGSNNIFWSNTTICHDSIIGSHNFFASNSTVGGYVEIGSRNFIGFSAVILQQLKVSNDILIGASSLVNRNPDSGAVYFGVPAKKIRSLVPQEGVVF